MAETANHIRAYRAALRAEQEAQDTYDRASVALTSASEALKGAADKRQAAYSALMNDVAGDITGDRR